MWVETRLRSGDRNTESAFDRPREPPPPQPMSVIVEFRIGGDRFALGEVLASMQGGRVEAERIVPAGGCAMPNLWVDDGDRKAFESAARDHGAIESVTAHESGGGAALYRLDWRGDDDDLIRSISEAKGTILDAVGDDGWEFRLRLPDQEALTTFHAACTERGLSVDVERTYGSAGNDASGRHGGVGASELTQPQREALVLGLREGYFETPSETTLSELADDLGVSQQALSSRIRRGTRNVLERALLRSEDQY